MSDKDELKKLQRDIAKFSASINRAVGDAPALLFREYAEKHLQQKLANPTLRDSSKALFRNAVTKHLVPAFGHEPLDKINNALWIAWVNRMRAEGSQLKMFFGARKALVEILNAAHREGLLERMPKLDNPDEAHNVGRVLTDKEVLSILWRAHRPFRFIFYVFWRMGCRPREILQWEWDMVDWRDNGAWLNVPARITKTDRSRSIPINSDVYWFLYRRKTRGNGSRFVFPDRTMQRPQLSYDSAWRTACRRAGVKKCVPYDFRRSFITRCAAQNLPLVYVAKILDTSVGLIERVYTKSNESAMKGIMK